jgi:hypothetical protein
MMNMFVAQYTESFYPNVAYIELGLVLYCKHIIFICGAWLWTTVGDSFERSPDPLAVSR